MPAYKAAHDHIERKIQTRTNADDYGKVTFELENQLKVFTLRLNKIFGKHTDALSSSYQQIRPEAYDQFFNRDFVNKLEFKLYRRITGSSEWELYKTISGSQLAQYGGNNNYKGLYQYSFTYLPCYSSTDIQYEYNLNP